MKSIIAIAFATLLSACASPVLTTDQMQRVASAVKPEDGRVLFASVAIWLPGANEFRFSAIEPKTPGVAVVTEKAFLFQQWGGVQGMTTVKRIPTSHIDSVGLISFGRSTRMVLREGKAVDSFAASDGQGELSMTPGTEEMYRTLLSLGVKSADPAIR